MTEQKSILEVLQIAGPYLLAFIYGLWEFIKSRKTSTEKKKLIAEIQKLEAEKKKLKAKQRRDRWLLWKRLIRKSEIMPIYWRKKSKSKTRQSEHYEQKIMLLHVN